MNVLVKCDSPTCTTELGIDADEPVPQREVATILESFGWEPSDEEEGEWLCPRCRP